MYDLGIMNGEVYVQGTFKKVHIYVREGIIAYMGPEVFDCQTYFDAAFHKVLPGFIDPHVHFELKGSYTSADDFESGSISAAFGGVTTFIDFLDPICKGEELEEAFIARRKLAKKSGIDFSFHATLKDPKGEVGSIVSEMKRLKLQRVKVFTTYSDSGRRTYEPELLELLTYSKQEGLLVLAHIEADDQISMEEGFTPQDLLTSRPSQAETEEALKMAHMVEETGGNLYMVHLSSGETLRRLKESFPKLINRQFFIESCPHYFLLDASRLAGEDGALYTMAPPLRKKEEQDLLRAQIQDVMVIGTDHCPFKRAEKVQVHLKDIPMGIGGVEHSFPLMYEHFGPQIINKMTVHPAKIHGIYPKKGVLQIGSDADMAFVKEDKAGSLITSSHSRCDYTVYQDFVVHEKVVATMVRGRMVMKDGRWLGGTGRYIEG